MFHLIDENKLKSGEGYIYLNELIKKYINNKEHAIQNPVFITQLLMMINRNGCDSKIADILLHAESIPKQSLKGIQNDAWGNLLHYLQAKCMENASYEDIMRFCFKHYPENAEGVDDFLGQLLQNDANFKQWFLQPSNKFIPLFNPPLSFETKEYHDVDKTLLRDLFIEKYDIMHECGFKKPLGSIEEDIINIHLFLMNHEAVIQQLDTLEKTLKEKKSHAQNERNEGYDQHNELLSSYLEEWGKEVGFKGIAIVRSALEPSEFLSLIAEGWLIKDIAFRGDIHGEWIHSIQMWLVLEYFKKQKELNSAVQLKNTLPTILQWIGKNEKISVWNRTFDRSSEVILSPYRPEYDARMVIELDQFIREEAKGTLPLLSNLLQSRAIKTNKSEGPRIEYREFGFKRKETKNQKENYRIMQQFKQHLHKLKNSNTPDEINIKLCQSFITKLKKNEDRPFDQLIEEVKKESPPIQSPPSTVQSKPVKRRFSLSRLSRGKSIDQIIMPEEKHDDRITKLVETVRGQPTLATTKKI